MTDDSIRVWRSAGRFAKLAATPVAAVGRVIQWVTLGTTLLALFGLGSFKTPWAWAWLFGVIGALAVWAGIRQQMRADALRYPKFSARLDYEIIRQNLSVAQFLEIARLWVVVENSGPPAEFVGRVRDVNGILNPGSYDVHAIAWEYGRDKARYLIERGGRERLRLAEMRRSGTQSGTIDHKSLRFFIPHAGMWSRSKTPDQGIGQELVPSEKVTFRLDIVNVTEDVLSDARVVLLLDPDGAVADFRIEM